MKVSDRDTGKEAAARELKEAFEAVDPYIQKLTEAVCPFCASVCCIDRHGRPLEDDMAVISTLEQFAPEVSPDGLSPASKVRKDDAERSRDEAPCRFLSSAGCILRRWQRPFRCTFYFCGPLIERMNGGSPREYREFIALLQRLVGARQRLLP